jgi:hypothetical protein
LLLLPVLYVGSYLALVVPAGQFVPDQTTFCTYTSRTSQLGGMGRLESYRIAKCQRFFWPLERVDQRLRPKAWAREDYDVTFSFGSYSRQ